MNKKPFVAAILFGALSLGGIFAMFSQTEPVSDTGERSNGARPQWISLNPSATPHPDFGKVLPAVIEKGVEHQLEKLSSDKEKNGEAKPQRNILRLR